MKFVNPPTSKNSSLTFDGWRLILRTREVMRVIPNADRIKFELDGEEDTALMTGLSVNEIRERYKRCGEGYDWFEDVPNDIYHASEGYSSGNVRSVIKGGTRQLRHDKASSFDSEPLLMGRAFHDKIGLPEVYASQYVVAPKVDRRTKAGKAAWAEFVEESGDKTVLTEQQSDTVVGMSNALRDNKIASEYIEYGIHETSIWAQCEYTGLWIKARPDSIHGNTLVDWKSSISSNAKGFRNKCSQFRYDVQAAWYLYVCKCAGLEADKFVFCVVDSKPPYLTANYSIREEDLTFGLADAVSALKKIKEWEDDNSNVTGYEYQDKITELKLW